MARWPLADLLDEYAKRLRRDALRAHEAELLRYTMACAAGARGLTPPALPPWLKD